MQGSAGSARGKSFKPCLRLQVSMEASLVGLDPSQVGEWVSITPALGGMQRTADLQPRPRVRSPRMQQQLVEELVTYYS
jgi:hypothetical protein